MNKKDKIFIKNKTFNNNILLFAFLIIVVLFIVVFSAINFYDSHKRKVIEDDYNILQQQIILNDLYKKYLDEGNSEKCTVLKNQLDSYLNINSELYLRLKKINRNAIVESDDRTKLLFVLTNINLWLHYNSIEKECGYNKERAILYFYPEFQDFSVEKAESDARTLFFAEKLERLTKECNLNSIALPYVNYIPILNQIISDYNISSSPSVYINGKVYYDVNLEDSFLKEIGCR
ncbi:MAG: hypothetical protein PHX47_01005 [Candidatus ainarchaeum sp.]|nr:hypothetical protein [Candidatus ainarchaeum sp.]